MVGWNRINDEGKETDWRQTNEPYQMTMWNNQVTLKMIGLDTRPNNFFLTRPIVPTTSDISALHITRIGSLGQVRTDSLTMEDGRSAPRRPQKRFLLRGSHLHCTIKEVSNEKLRIPRPSSNKIVRHQSKSHVTEKDTQWHKWWLNESRFFDPLSSCSFSYIHYDFELWIH